MPAARTGFLLPGTGEVSLTPGAGTPIRPAVLEAVLRWNTFMGSSTRGPGAAWGYFEDTATDIAADGAGKVYVTGCSEFTWGHPVDPFTDPSHAPVLDNEPYCNAFVAALDAATGTLLWNTFLGSSEWNGGKAVAVDGAGKVYVAGYSGATWGSPVDPFVGKTDAFVAALDAATGTRLWHTFLGGPDDDYGEGIAVDRSGRVYVTGRSHSAWGTPVNPFAGSGDAFVTALNAANGTRLWHTFLGGAGFDEGSRIAVDGAGKLYLAGTSNAPWGSPVNPFAGSSGFADAFVAGLDAATGARLWSTFLGSSDVDEGAGVAVDAAGKVYITGTSRATWGTPVDGFAGDHDAFVAALDGVTGTRLWNTFLGSSGTDGGSGIVADRLGKVYVTGVSYASWGSPVNPFAQFPLYPDAFVAGLDAATGTRLWNTFLPSPASAIALDGAGVYVAGCATSAGSGTWGHPVNAFAGGVSDAFVAALGAGSNRSLLRAGDFDGDRKADMGVYRPAERSVWFLRYSAAGGFMGYWWGTAGDIPVPGDYDGDGKTDVAVFRPSDGGWYLLKSSGGMTGVRWGTAGDIPVPADYDGDGKTDVAVFRPSDGGWYILKSSGGTTGVRWGMMGDIPAPADYDGDGKADLCVFRPAYGSWLIHRSDGGPTGLASWGTAGDLPVPGDFDGDHKADVGVYRPSDNGWYILKSSTGAATAFTWGIAGDVAVFGDFDGDGRADPAVFRPSDGGWYVLKSSGGSMGLAWGTVGDLPV